MPADATLAPLPAQTAPTPNASDWDALARAWTAHCPQPLWRAHSDAINSALLTRWLPGTGVGRALKTDLFDEAVAAGLYPTLAARARHVCGIDISAEAVSAAAARYPRLQPLVADVRRLPFHDESFDAVVSTSTLDHFDSRLDVAAALGELHRILRPRGVLIVTMDNLANPLVALRNALPYELLHRLGVVPYYVGRSFGPDGLRHVVREQGFEVDACTAVLHFPRVFAVPLARLADAVGGVRARAAFLNALAGVERLGRWPTRFVTGHYVAVRAIKPTG